MLEHNFTRDTYASFSYNFNISDFFMGFNSVNALLPKYNDLSYSEYWKESLKVLHSFLN
jgi:hypothetical protein